METTLKVKDQAEGRAIRIALADPQVRAFVVIMGMLLPLPTDRARARVLNFIIDKTQEQAQITT